MTLDIQFFFEQVRLLSLLLHLSNSYRCTQEDDDEDEISMWPFREVVENLEEEKRKKREQVLKLLAQGEKSWSPPGTSGLYALLNMNMNII